MSRPDQLAAILRFECLAEEDRPMVVSYVTASLLALSWLLLVHLVPQRFPPSISDPDDRIIVVVPPPVDFPLPSVVADAGRRARPASPAGGSQGAGTVRDMFSGNAGLVDAGNLLRGIDPAPSGSTPADVVGGKVGLSTDVGSRTPGRARGSGLSPTSAGVGTVAGNGVARSAVTIAPPEVRAIAPGGLGGDASAVGQTARAHVPQLARCYHEEGLSRNASLAGLVRLAITVEGGRVTSAQIVDRSWTGAGVAEAESCLLRAVRGWRLGNSDARIVLPLSFTSQQR
jgi:hypothetical protein